MLKLIIRCCFVLEALSASFAIAGTVTVESGNGTVGGPDSEVTFLLGPATGDFSSPFTAVDFSDAQSGPAAFILTPWPGWVLSLSENPTAQWIGSNSTASTSQGNTALYAISFTIPDAFSSASLSLYWAVDDGLGSGQGDQFLYVNGNALYLEGNPACNSMIGVANQFNQEESATCTGISSLLQAGTNWLYFDDINLINEAGIVFSATVTTTDMPEPATFGLIGSALVGLWCIQIRANLTRMAIQAVGGVMVNSSGRPPLTRPPVAYRP